MTSSGDLVEQMKQIFVSTEVFSMIWACREPGEEEEDAILRRVLGGKRQASLEEKENKGEMLFIESPKSGVSRDDRWWRVVEEAVRRIGRAGTLTAIYKSTRDVCKEIGKPMPSAFEETVRGTLKDNSANSDRWKGVRDVFSMPRGKHAGYWALRQA